jgi:UDP-N-acetylglucosamine transferase subunit ALG13
MNTKKLLLAACLLFGVTVNSQEILTVKQEKIYVTITASVEAVVKEDTTHYLAITFRNAQYQHINDYGVISFATKEDSNKFIDEAKRVVEYAGKGSLTVSFNGGSITVSGKIVTLYNSRGKYVYVSKKNLQKIINFLENNADVLI